MLLVGSQTADEHLVEKAMINISGGSSGVSLRMNEMIRHSTRFGVKTAKNTLLIRLFFPVPLKKNKVNVIPNWF